jgi:two-component system, chemotaxis family, protein-glutamate methylesterase/glutaminase
MGTAPGIAVRDAIRSGAVDPVRVLVVDDSPTVRAVFARLIDGEADLEVTGSEESAERALATLLQTSPDVILLDLDMPGMGGLDAMPRMIELAAPARILVVSSLAGRGAEQTLAALSLGAADTLAKPKPGKFDKDYRATLLRKIRLLGRVAKRSREKAAPPAQPQLRPHPKEVPHLIAIGASTGGIHALGQLLGALSQRVQLPILITQHLPGSFMEPFVRQLRAASDRPTVVACEGMPVIPKRIIVAPGDAHLTVASDSEGTPVVRLQDGPVASGCRPSVDPMFESCARFYGAHSLGVVLSGMGRDGAEGAAKIVRAGGTIMAQDAASSAVWGMPGAVASAGLASAVLPPEQIALRIAAALGAS